MSEKRSIINIRNLSDKDVNKTVDIYGEIQIAKKSNNGQQYFSVSVKDKTGTGFINVFSEDSETINLLKYIRSGDSVILNVTIEGFNKEKNNVFFKKINSASLVVGNGKYILPDLQSYVTEEIKKISDERYKKFIADLLAANQNFWIVPAFDLEAFNYKGGLVCYTAKMLKFLDANKNAIEFGNLDLYKAMIFAKHSGNCMVRKEGNDLVFVNTGEKINADFKSLSLINSVKFIDKDPSILACCTDNTLSSFEASRIEIVEKLINTKAE